MPAGHEWTLLPVSIGAAMPRLTLFGAACILLVAIGALALSWVLPLETEDAVAESVFAGMVATSVAMVFGRFPI